MLGTWMRAAARDGWTRLHHPKRRSLAALPAGFACACMWQSVAAQLLPLHALDVPFFQNGGVHATVGLPDGSFIIGGDFTTVSAKPHGGVAKIKADCTLDSTWNPSIDGTVETLALAG